MSLVHEALQKAEREKQRKAIVVPPRTPPTPGPSLSPAAVIAPPAAATTVQPQRTHHVLLTTLIVCVSIVALVAIVYLVSNATSMIRGSRQAVTSPSTLPASSPTELTRVQTEAPAAPAQEVRFKLTGITKDPGDGKYLAIINGQLRAESQYVDGATIKKIERDRVTIELNGREQVLRLF